MDLKTPLRNTQIGTKNPTFLKIVKKRYFYAKNTDLVHFKALNRCRKEWVSIISEIIDMRI